MTASKAEESSKDAAARSSRPWRRLGVLVVVLVLVALAGRAAGLTDHLTPERLPVLVREAGALGIALFIVAFAVGELLHIPGLVFVGAAVAVWGRPLGGAIGYVAAVVSVTTSFVIVRAAGAGNALGTVQRPFVQRLLAGIDRRPVITVATLRVIFLMAPPLNYALALTSIKFRDYFVGSVLGLAPPIVAAVWIFGWAIGTG